MQKEVSAQTLSFKLHLFFYIPGLAFTTDMLIMHKCSVGNVKYVKCADCSCLVQFWNVNLPVKSWMIDFYPTIQMWAKAPTSKEFH